jgi:hypothetical protein
MKLRHTLLFGLAIALGALFGTASTGISNSSASQQCYYTVGVDPPTACTTCTGICLGAGYKCCTINVE